MDISDCTVVIVPEPGGRQRGPLVAPIWVEWLLICLWITLSVASIIYNIYTLTHPL